MNFNEGEYGSVLRVNLDTDISAGTTLTVELEPQTGDLKSFTSNVALGTVNVTVDDQTFVANEYLEYTLQDGDLDQAGQWRARGSAIVSGVLIKSDFVRFTVLP
jgi:hypothetical protein